MGFAKVSSIFLVALFLINGCYSTTFTVVNKCNYTVWPGLVTGDVTTNFPEPSGFTLNTGESRSISIPYGWAGRLWARTLCNTTGAFTCVTGNCGSSTIECSDAGSIRPATVAEFTLNGPGNLDSYDVSLVDGFNVPMTIIPRLGKPGVGNCTVTGCPTDLNAVCPDRLKVPAEVGGAAVACMSACVLSGKPEDCCSGAFGTPDTCKPSNSSAFFKKACPRAYSYAYEAGTNTYTCSDADYLITLCAHTYSPSPPRSSQPDFNSVSTASSLAASGTIFSVAFSLCVLGVARFL
ncbi:unnamed protein product [Microthlaspi erraticum]|uniref:Thaumatin-like protein n=1 Tax=Microthlaspi erraticum TaxID=1685480 RepID=A0A6D2I5W3_9BRAS|nr:unnamed protein product [Microthlaspi erraticum]